MSKASKLMIVLGIAFWGGIGSAQGPPTRRADQVLSLVLYNSGFEQSLIRVPPGRTLVNVDNRSHVPEVTLDIRREAGESVKALDSRRGRRISRDVIQLAPGSYIVSVAGAPKWIARIEVSGPQP